jgi:hypothetical protein
VISRYLVIALAFGAAVMQFRNGAWLEAVGLVGLGGGLTMLKLAETRPGLKCGAYAGFAVTAIAMFVVIFQRYL